MLGRIRIKIRRFFLKNPCDEAEALCNIIFHPDYDDLNVPLKWYKYYLYKFFKFMDDLNCKYDNLKDFDRFCLFLIISFGPIFCFKALSFIYEIELLNIVGYISFVAAGAFRISYFRSFWK